MKNLLKTISPILLVLIIGGAFPTLNTALFKFSSITGLIESYNALNDSIRSIIPDEIEKLVSTLAKSIKTPSAVF